MFHRFVLHVTTLCVLVSALVGAEEPTVAVFSRHTFRGVGDWVGPMHFKVGKVEFDLPLLGYGMDATAHGLEMAQTRGSRAVQEAAELAVRGLGPDSTYKPHWDEIRADLACGRDFYTALYFRAGLAPEQQTPIALTGCPTRQGEPVDAVTVGAPVRGWVPTPELRKLQVNSANAKRLQEAGDDLLRVLAPLGGSALPLPPVYDEAQKMRPEYGQMRMLAQVLEMVAEQGPPLRTLFPEAPAALVSKLDPDVVRKASAYLGVAFMLDAPMQVAYAAAKYPVEYINELPPGRRVILLSHDDDLSMLIRALGLISDDGERELQAVYPMESIVFALDSKRACVVRARMQLAADGSFAGNFASKVIWRGTREEWESRVQNVYAKARSWPVALGERNSVKILPAVRLDVRYPTR